MQHVPHFRQRGGVMVFAAIALSVIVITLSLADIGFLYYYKREYQKAADLSAMAGARKLIDQATGTRSCDGNARPAATDNAARNLGSKSYVLQIDCGRWNPTATTADGRLDTAVPEEELDAVRAIVSGAPPRFLPFAEAVTISARAIAVADQPMAQLTIRSTVATIDTQQSALLNGVVGGLLGGSINLPVAAWNGLLNTDINLLRYLDALALELGVSAGNYDQVLGAELTLGRLLEVAADVLQQGGGSGDISAAIGGLEGLLGVHLPAFDPLIRLGDILDVQTGTPASGLDAALNLLQLVQGSVQLANSACAVCANLPIDLPGVAGVQIRSKVLEPPQLSAIGNPVLASANPLGPDRIYVRTAQVRTLISVDLPISGSVLSNLQTLLNDNAVVSGLTNAVNDLLSLNLVGLLETLSCVIVCDIQRDVIDIQVLATPRIDLNLDAGSGDAYVNDHDCAPAAKALQAPTATSVANLRIGRMGTSAADAADKVFASSAAPVVEPIPLLDIGHRRVRYQCTLLLICSVRWQTEAGTWNADKNLSYRHGFTGGGIGLKADVPIAGSDYTLLYSNPPDGGLPEIGAEPAWQAASSSGLINGLNSALQGLELEFYQPTAGSGITGGGLGGVLYLVGSAVQTLVDTLMTIIANVLSPLLDPLIDFLLNALGVDLGKVEVGGNLSCNGGGTTLVN